MKRILLASMLLVLPIAAAAESRGLTYVDLVNRMIDIERLAVLPQPGDRSEQWSSYDRKSRYDPETDSYIQWAANDDGTGFIRKEGDLFVLAEIEGPGCIWRIWSALATEGHVKIYLDGATEPTVDLPFSGYFNGENPPFTYPALVHEVAHGLNGYVPIPFQKSCKIVAEEGWGRYFHFTYQKFPEGTVVPTFTRELSADDEAALRAVDEFLSNRLGTDPAGSRPGEVTQRTNVAVPAGETVTVAEITGERAISAFRVRLDREALGNPADALRQIVLRITWDDDKAPAVWCPLGDFFGTAPGINYYESLLAGMTGEEFYSLWYMPFGEKALIEVVNESDAEVRMGVAITHAPLSSPIEELGRFHVKWHRDALLPAQPGWNIDWTILKTRGRGRYCGAMLHVWNPPAYWWGEGDEKFFIDGEKFPSTFGTGTEDYFGYAWCDPATFQNAYHNQTYNDYGHTGVKSQASLNRWHLGDSIPFQESFEGYFEKYKPNKNPTLYACTVYWYLSPDGDDPYGPVPVEERIGYYTKPWKKPPENP